MSEYIKLFNNHNEYTAFTADTTAFVKPNVSHCITENDVHYNPIPKPFEPLYLYSDETTSEDLKTSKTVVGIVVAPKEHFNDGKMRVISLYNMDSGTTTTHTGITSNVRIEWSTSNIDITGITNIDSLALINANNTIKGNSYQGCFPSDAFTNDYIQDIDGVSYAYWGKYSTTSIGFLPSPFLADGISKNPIYTDNSVTNALAYIGDGITNTDAIIDEWYASGGTTVDGIRVSSGCPAASACRLYCPNFHNGEWYLPTIGELGYVMANFNVINEKIVAAGGIAVASDVYRSSTEQDYFRVWDISVSTGVVNTSNGSKQTKRPIRAFLAL